MSELLLSEAGGDAGLDDCSGEGELGREVIMGFPVFFAFHPFLVEDVDFGHS